MLANENIEKQSPQDQWLLSNSILNNRPALSLKAGLSAQVCFAKFVAYKKKMVYVGYGRAAPVLTDNFLEETLDYVYRQVKSLQNTGKTVLYSPGICSVPYLVETGNLIYLPSHFLVGVNSIKQLQKMLAISHEKGYRCYAVVGYDPFIKDKLCAWIKFTHPPKQYLSLIIELQIKDVLLMSVHDHRSNHHGSQRYARLLAGCEMERERIHPLSRDIYLLYINEGYGKVTQKDNDIFKKLITDVSQQELREISKRPLMKFIHDWQSGIDCIRYLQARFRQQLPSNISFYYILHSDSFKLYLCATYLGRAFISHNFDPQAHPITAKGVVFNQYFMNNPTYELNYGYVPILYWQFYPQNEKRLSSVLSEQELKLSRLYNMHKGTTAPLIQADSVSIVTNHEGLELGQWISKHAPEEYKVKELSLQQLLDALIPYKLVYRSKEDSISENKEVELKLIN